MNDSHKQGKHLFGIGLDNRDGHKRLTQADRFTLVGGSQETHERMTETVVKTFEDLRRKGRDFDHAEPREIADLLKKNTPQT